MGIGKLGLALWVAAASAPAQGQEHVTTDAAAIMARVAANMESGVEARRKYLYQQQVTAKLVRTNGQIARQERREYRAVPGKDRTEKHLVRLDGEYQKSRNDTIRYSEPGFKKGGMDIDGELMEDLIEHLVNDKKSRDGIPHSLFPLTTKDLPFYHFTHKGIEEHQGRRTHRIAFEPASKSNCVHIGSDEGGKDCRTPWKGEALIDAAESQPLRIATDLDFRMPWGVKVFLGTNLRQTGFSVNYRRVAENVWFPVAYGTEFRLDVLFGYKRVITMALDSRDFRRTEVDSGIRFDETRTP